MDAAGELAPASKQEIDEVAYWLVERFFKDSFQALPGPTPNASPNASPNLNPNPSPPLTLPLTLTLTLTLALTTH